MIDIGVESGLFGTWDRLYFGDILMTQEVCGQETPAEGMGHAYFWFEPCVTCVFGSRLFETSIEVGVHEPFLGKICWFGEEYQVEDHLAERIYQLSQSFVLTNRVEFVGKICCLKVSSAAVRQFFSQLSGLSLLHIQISSFNWIALEPK